MSLKSNVPWWAKISAKLVLSRLPLGYKLWKQLGLFTHGYMEKPDYAFGVFKEHFDRVEFKMLSLYKNAGFDIDVIGVKRWNKLPTPRARRLSENERVGCKCSELAPFSYNFR